MCIVGIRYPPKPLTILFYLFIYISQSSPFAIFAVRECQINQFTASIVHYTHPIHVLFLGCLFCSVIICRSLRAADRRFIDGRREQGKWLESSEWVEQADMSSWSWMASKRTHILEILPNKMNNSHERWSTQRTQYCIHQVDLKFFASIAKAPTGYN